jgi:hypothetical protein
MYETIPLGTASQEAWYTRLRVAGLLEQKREGLEHRYQLSKRVVKCATYWYLVKQQRFASGR